MLSSQNGSQAARASPAKRRTASSRDRGGSRSPRAADLEERFPDREFLLKKEWLLPGQESSTRTVPDSDSAKGRCCERSGGFHWGAGLCALGLAVIITAWIVALLSEETCANHGCGNSGAEFKCQCHVDCIREATCCSDYADICIEDGSGLAIVSPEVESCANYGCKYDKDNACQCNSDCEKHNNCCADYAQTCTKSAKGSCAAYGCSLERREHLCQCYPDCAHSGDCCTDYVDTCRGRAQGIIGTVRTSTEVSTSVTATTFTSTTTRFDWNGDPRPLEDLYDPPPAGGDGYNLFYVGDNPLGIQAHPQRDMNYFLVLGDWGTPGGPGECQLQVAEAMKRYVLEQREAGMRLLFVGTVGDNFYWTGVRPQSWEVSWAAPYGVNDPGSPFFQVPWLATMGNHDYGEDDTFAFCPEAEPQFSIHGQAYAGLQLNRDRNPKRPKVSDLNTTHFWFPDYSYHYSIPEAELEVISFDTNAGFVDILGGDENGHKKAFERCKGRRSVESFLSRVQRASTDLLVRRAQEGTAKTVVLLQHYPGQCQKEVFLGALPESRQGQVRVLCAYGHVHDQKCEGGEGSCDTVMTGGGGGCCIEDLQAPMTTLAALHGIDVDSEPARAHGHW